AAAAQTGYGWRATFTVTAVVGAVALAFVWRLPMHAAEREPGDSIVRALLDGGRGAVRALRRGAVLRWLVLLNTSDLMLDVLHGFLALYFVDVMGATDARAAFAVVVYTGIGLVGDALMVPLLRRVDGARYMCASALAMLVAFPLFLLLDDSVLKLGVLACVGVLNAGWYPILKARLYGAMPGQSATVMALESVSGIAGGLLPLSLAA